MKMHHVLSSILLFSLSLIANTSTAAAIEQTAALNTFINKMAGEHQYTPDELKELFANVEIKESILKAIASPAEGMPWYKYRKIFMTDSRINKGVKFWQENQQVLAKVEQQYGIPAEVIVAIIGVETQYGENTGSYRVIDALSTLGFAYPKRSKFFLSELENFLLLCREENMLALQPTGSYAGAMGMPQFMPSSYRAYAVDFDEDNFRDIWNNPADVIASIANYLSRHHWQAGEPVTFPVKATGTAYQSALSKGLKPNISIKKLTSLNVQVPDQLDDNLQVKLLEFTMEKDTALWIGLANFYAITRYNHSSLYAMAVYQLSQAIADGYHP